MTSPRCPVCGVVHATCGPQPGHAGTPVGTITEARKAVAGSKVETRWVNHNGQWRLFKLNAEDSRYANSEPYEEGERAPGEMDPAYEQARAAHEASQAAAAEREAQGKSRTAANKARGGARNKAGAASDASVDSAEDAGAGAGDAAGDTESK